MLYSIVERASSPNKNHLISFQFRCHTLKLSPKYSPVVGSIILPSVYQHPLHCPSPWAKGRVIIEVPLMVKRWIILARQLYAPCPAQHSAGGNTEREEDTAMAGIKKNK